MTTPRTTRKMMAGVALVAAAVGGHALAGATTPTALADPSLTSSETQFVKDVRSIPGLMVTSDDATQAKKGHKICDELAAGYDGSTIALEIWRDSGGVVYVGQARDIVEYAYHDLCPSVR